MHNMALTDRPKACHHPARTAFCGGGALGTLGVALAVDPVNADPSHFTRPGTGAARYENDGVLLCPSSAVSDPMAVRSTDMSAEARTTAGTTAALRFIFRAEESEGSG